MTQLKRSMQEASRYSIGTLVPGKGIFAGPWQPAGGLWHGRPAQLFAAPQDLVNASGQQHFKFHEAAIEVARLQNWHGHDGAPREDFIFEEIVNGTYRGQWFIPPMIFLSGIDRDHRPVFDYSLYKNKAVGAFAGTFATGSKPYSYWSSTLSSHGSVQSTDFSDRPDDPSHIHVWSAPDFSYRCRPVRLEVPGFGS